MGDKLNRFKDLVIQDSTIIRLHESRYFKYPLFDRIDRYGGYFVSRLKGNANPLIVAVNRKHGE